MTGDLQTRTEGKFPLQAAYQTDNKACTPPTCTLLYPPPRCLEHIPCLLATKQTAPVVKLNPHRPPVVIHPHTIRSPVAPVLCLPVDLGVEVDVVQHHHICPCEVQALVSGSEGGTALWEGV